MIATRTPLAPPHGRAGEQLIPRPPFFAKTFHRCPDGVKDYWTAEDTYLLPPHQIIYYFSVGDQYYAAETLTGLNEEYEYLNSPPGDEF